jgi:predicted dehydrogenase
MSKALGAAVIGDGFMGKARPSAYANVDHSVTDLPDRGERRVLCGRDAAKAQALAGARGYRSAETDWRAVAAVRRSAASGKRQTTGLGWSGKGERGRRPPIGE